MYILEQENDLRMSSIKAFLMCFKSRNVLVKNICIIDCQPKVDSTQGLKDLSFRPKSCLGHEKIGLYVDVLQLIHDHYTRHRKGAFKKINLWISDIPLNTKWMSEQRPKVK